MIEKLVYLILPDLPYIQLVTFLSLIFHTFSTRVKSGLAGRIWNVFAHIFGLCRMAFCSHLLRKPGAGRPMDNRFFSTSLHQYKQGQVFSQKLKKNRNPEDFFLRFKAILTLCDVSLWKACELLWFGLTCQSIYYTGKFTAACVNVTCAPQSFCK